MLKSGALRAFNDSVRCMLSNRAHYTVNNVTYYKPNSGANCVLNKTEYRSNCGQSSLWSIKAVVNQNCGQLRLWSVGAVINQGRMSIKAVVNQSWKKLIYGIPLV